MQNNKQAKKPAKPTLIEFLKTQAGKPLSFKELAVALGVARADNDAFKRVIRELLADGEIVKIRGDRYGLPSKMNLVTGVISCHQDGYGFVCPEGEGADVYVGRGKMKGAMHNDKVVVRVEGVKSGGKREGSIIRIVARANKTLVGKFRAPRSKGAPASVSPSDEKITTSIMIPEGQSLGAKEGDIVEAEITAWPYGNEPAVGKILEVLGRADDPDVEIEVIAKKYRLPRRFPPEVALEAKNIPSEVLPSEIKGREDLRGRTVVTIDGETAKDFDDAVSIERTALGYKLFVSIADVSHYVKEGTDLDKEAYQRGTSVYFPDRCIPMLPERISNGIASLNPNVERLTMTAEIEFDENGAPVRTSFYESVIKSSERLTYTNVKKTLTKEDPSVSGRYAHIEQDLKTMEELALKLFKRRMEQGSIDFDLPEPQIIIDIEGRPVDIVKSERNVAHRIVEEFMLSANRAVAEFFSSAKYPFVYRIHETPDAASVAEFKEFAAGLGLRLEEKTSPKSFQRLLAAAADTPYEKLINHVLLRTMRQAVYSDKNLGHFGLAFEDYTHFTSPIRRYPDLVVHRLLKKALRKEYTAKERERLKASLPEITSHASARERNAMEAEREIVDLKKVQFMKDKAGEVLPGIVSGVTSFGFFVELKDYFVEGLVHVTSLKDDYYVFTEKKHMLVGEKTKRKFQVGMEVTVKITKVDMEKRRLDMELPLDGKNRRDKRR
ncbi:MAG TPA: ribonuclease R [Thermodesulfobacteriota bacterium]|nr:ribonuclease R [Thermodesulfobacteriota bacterium]